MENEKIEKLVSIRNNLVARFDKLKDYKSNKNAIMKEYDHAKLIHETIIKIDDLLKDHVNFSDKK